MPKKKKQKRNSSSLSTILLLLGFAGAVYVYNNREPILPPVAVETQIVHPTYTPTPTPVPTPAYTPIPPRSSFSMLAGGEQQWAEVPIINLDPIVRIVLQDLTSPSSSRYGVAGDVQPPESRFFGPPCPSGTESIRTGHYFMKPVSWGRHEGEDVRCRSPGETDHSKWSYWVAAPTDAVVYRIANANTGSWTNTRSDDFRWWSSGTIVVLKTSYQGQNYYIVNAHMVDPDDPSTFWPGTANLVPSGGWPRVGDEISAGQIIWVLGNTGNTNGPHNHYVIAREEVNGSLTLVNPAKWGALGLRPYQ